MIRAQLFNMVSFTLADSSVSGGPRRGSVSNTSKCKKSVKPRVFYKCKNLWYIFRGDVMTCVTVSPSFNEPCTFNHHRQNTQVIFPELFSKRAFIIYLIEYASVYPFRPRNLFTDAQLIALKILHKNTPFSR